MASNTLKPVFHSKKAYLSYARKHLKIMKSKDTRYLKYFAQQCQEKIENREIVPEKSTIDWDFFCHVWTGSLCFGQHTLQNKK